MKLMHPLAVALAVVLAFAALDACGGGDGGGLAGSYEADGGKTTLEILDDQTFSMDTAKKQHVTGTWKRKDEVIEMNGKADGGKPMTVRGAIESGAIRVKFGPKEVVYTKK